MKKIHQSILELIISVEDLADVFQRNIPNLGLPARPAQDYQLEPMLGSQEKLTDREERRRRRREEEAFRIASSRR